MALTQVDEPVEIVLARNPAVLHLRSAQTVGGALYSALGVSASMSILVTDRFAAGETITVDYDEPDGTSESIEFTAAGSYDPATDEIPDDTWAGTDSEYWIEVATIINSHPRIAPFFTCDPVTVMGSLYIKVLARDTSAAWYVTLSNTGGFSVATDAGSSDATPDNYRVLAEVFFEKTYNIGDYERVAQLEAIPATDTGWTYFDISSILAAHCRSNRSEPLVPAFGTDALALADNLRRYYIRYTEDYGSPSETQEWQYTDIKYVMDGGVSQAVHAEAGYFGYLSEKSVSDAFLTWMPDGKTIGESQPEYLAWYNYTGSDKTVTLEVVRYDVDTGAPKATLYAYEFDLTARAYETILFPVSPDILAADLSTSFATDVYKLVLRVVDASSDYEGGDPTYLSEQRTYYIDRQYYEPTRYVQYLNSFGVPECWRCTGDWTKKLAVKRELATKSLAPGYNSLASDNFQYGRTFTPGLIYRTGYLRKGEAEVLQELLLAGECYDVEAAGYIPLLITSTSFDVTGTRETLHSYQLNAQPRLDMKNFSKKQVTAGSADSWQEPDGSSWFDALLVAWQEP